MTASLAISDARGFLHHAAGHYRPVRSCPRSRLSGLGTSYASYWSFLLVNGTVLPKMWGKITTRFAAIMLGLTRVAGSTNPIHALMSDPKNTRSKEREPRETAVPWIAPGAPGARIAPPGGLRG